jgi:hypothetical protein
MCPRCPETGSLVSRDDILFLMGLAVIPAWTFVALPLSYDGAPMMTIIQTVVSLFAFTVAFIALLVANAQLSLNRKNQRETTAKTNFREFLKLCVEYPKFAWGDPDGQQDRYEWFVAHFLWAVEEILEFAPGEWENNLKLHINYHRNFLENNARFQREDLPTYTPKLRDFLRKTLEDSPTAAAGSTITGVYLTPQAITAVDNWSANQPGRPQRDQAIGLLVARGLI